MKTVKEVLKQFYDKDNVFQSVEKAMEEYAAQFKTAPSLVVLPNQIEHDLEIKSITKSMSELFRMHDYQGMYNFYTNVILPTLQRYKSDVEFKEMRNYAIKIEDELRIVKSQLPSPESNNEARKIVTIGAWDVGKTVFAQKDELPELIIVNKGKVGKGDINDLIEHKSNEVKQMLSEPPLRYIDAQGDFKTGKQSRRERRNKQRKTK